MDIGIEKIPYDFDSSFSYPFKGENAAIGTTDVKKKLHLTGSQQFLFHLFSTGNPQLLFHLKDPLGRFEDRIWIKGDAINAASN
jgi:hypothetical protein